MRAIDHKCRTFNLRGLPAYIDGEVKFDLASDAVPVCKRHVSIDHVFNGGHAQSRNERRRITLGEYDKKARELKERQAEIASRIEQHQQGDAEYRTTLENLISSASRAAELFERSKIEQKRQLRLSCSFASATDESMGTMKAQCSPTTERLGSMP